MNDSRVTVGLKKVPIHLHSSQNRIFIKGGKIVNDDRMFEADIYVEDGVIKQVGTNLMVPGGVRTIEARGKLVIPGGVDANTNLQMPCMGTKSCDDFYSGTKAALAGGTTTIMDFVRPKRGQSLTEAYDQYREVADAKVCCDYSLHVIVPQFNESVAKDMAVLVSEKGVNSFKAFMAYPGSLMLEDDELIGLMERCRDLGAVIQVHAENGKVAEKKSEEVVRLGITGPEGLLFAQPEEVEFEATNRAIMLSDTTCCPLYVSPVMSRTASQRIADARRAGSMVWGETLAVALATDGRAYEHSSWRHAASHVTHPPLRPDPVTPGALMRLLANGDMEVAASSHCAFKVEQRALGMEDFRKIPPGVNGLEDRMSVIWEKGVVAGVMDPCRFVAVTSTNAAKVFNVYPRKGRIDVGSDADIVIWNEETTRTISSNSHHEAGDFNVFEGLTCHGVPEMVITGGRIVLEEGQLKVTQGVGRFVPTPAHCHYLYGRVEAKKKLRCMKGVTRDAYSGPVVDLSKEEEEMVNTNGNKPQHPDEAPIVNYGPTRGGGRSMQESSFSLSGAQIDDTRPARSGIRTKQPPGGSSSGPLW